MQIEVTTDRNIESGAELIRQIEQDTEAALARWSEQLTRVEVHLGDENADKYGAADKRCMVEARWSGKPPVAVTDHGATVEVALAGALKKLQALLDRRAGRSDDRKGGPSIRHGGD